MVKETMVNEEKKTVWVRFTSWLATSWLGKAWNWLFGGNDASKANAAKPNGGTPTQSQSQGEGKGPAPQQGPQAPEGQGTGQPEGKTSTQSQGEGKGPAPQQELKASIRINNGELEFASMTAYTADYTEKCKNQVNDKEYLVYVKHGEDMYRIIYTRDNYGRNNINSVAKQHEDTKHMNDNAVSPNDNMKGVKALLGLSETTTWVGITEISSVPFTPEVKTPEPAANGKVPSSTSANPKQQHVAGNGPKK